MTLPHTLGGIIGFLAFVIFIIGMVDSQEVQNQLTDMGASFEQVIKNNNDYLGPLAVVTTPFIYLGIIITAPILLAETLFNSLTSTPAEIQIFWVFVMISLTIAFVKLVRGVWDY